MRLRIKKGLQNALTHDIIQSSQGKSPKPSGRGWTWWTMHLENSDSENKKLKTVSDLTQ